MRVHVFPDHLDLTPGEPAAIQVDVFNDRDVIDSFIVSLLGVGAESVSVQPPELSLFPSSEGSVTVVFTPSVDLAAGTRAAGVKVQSKTEATLSQTERLPITVAELTAISLEVQPQTLTAGHRGHFRLVAENRGNTKASVSLSGIDPEQALQFSMSPSRLVIAPGEQRIARAVVSGKRPFMGTPAARVMTFRADGDGGRKEIMATFIQRPRVSRGIVTFLALLVAVAVWALALLAGFSRLLTHEQTAKAASSTAAAAGSGSGSGKGAAGAAGAGGSASGAGAAGGSGAAGAGTGQISGTVVGPSATPASAQAQAPQLAAPGNGTGTAGVPGAVVEAFPAANTTQLAMAAVADPSGAFTLVGLAPGSYKLRATATGYQALWYPAAATPDQGTAVTVAAGPAPPVTIMLNGLAGSVSGIIQSVTGPVSGALVSVVGSNQRGVMSGSDGTFTLAGLATPAADELMITKAGFPDTTVAVNLTAGEQLTGQELLLSVQSGAVSGTVSDDLGTPLAGAKIAVDNAGGALLSSATSMSSGNVGFFIVSGLPTPSQDTVVVSDAGYQPFTTQVSLTAGTATIDLSPQLTPVPLSLTGTVSRSATAGASCPPCTLAGVSVMAVGKTVTGTATTTAAGTYAIPNLLPGQYTVTFGDMGYTSTSINVTLSPGQNGTQNASLVAPPVTISGPLPCDNILVRGQLVHVTLTTAAGASVPGVAAGAFVSPGTYVLSDVPSPGTYVVHAAYPYNLKSQQSIAILPGQNNSVTLPCPG